MKGRAHPPLSLCASVCADRASKASATEAWMRTVMAAVAAVLILGSAARAADDCHIGAYRFANGDVVDIGPADEGTLRWKMFDGTVGTLHPKDGGWTSTFGWTERPDGHRVELAGCARGELTFDGKTA